MNRINFICLLLCLTILGARPAQTQTQTLLYEFQGSPDGATPEGNLLLHNGHLYGVTAAGGTGDSGTVFDLSPNSAGGWNEAVLYNFCSRPNCIDGSIPTYAYGIFDSHGNMYGTTWTGGVYNHGVVWELSRSQAHWKETVLYSFRHGNGVSGLVMDSSGNLYGCTYDGRRASSVFELSPSQAGWTEKTILKIDETYSGLAIDGAGNLFGSTLSYVFELSPNGSGGWSGSTIYNFKANEDGEFEIPTLDSAGNIYGTTESGGQTDQGAVWRLTPVEIGSSNKSWTEQILYSFQGTQTDGSFPYGGVVLDAAGNIYGTTLGGGVEERGTVYELSPVSGGTYSETFLWGFNITDGASPYASLILDSSRNLYGTAAAGGSNSAGVVFELTPYGVTEDNNWDNSNGGGSIFEVNAAGVYTSFYSFSQVMDSGQNGPLLQSTDGNFYGITPFGQDSNSGSGYGTVFRFSNGLIPLVKTVPVAGKVGKSVILLGNGLTGTTSVTFNSVGAAFAVESDTFIKATVPAGATTGTVSVVTPSGTLNSNPQFVVTK